ncbi:MAG TPA: DUF488 family protein [Myxococcaceae bacterium]|nr:DUF488 family protein [Myxococcaceae bacterium]
MTHRTFRVKRTYAEPARGDGLRVLVERLWPRGQTRAQVAAEAWLRELAPSPGLRRWFDHRPERWKGFLERYHAELAAHPEAWAPLLEAIEKRPVTLLYSARDEAHNAAIALASFLEAQRA